MSDTTRRSELRVEVPGTPEQVWDAIATGPGITSWFVPAEVEEREGGSVTFHLGLGDDGDSDGTVTAWEPPHRFAYEERWQPEGAATEEAIGTEFLVEARAGGTCVVRLVTTGFGSDEEWADAVEQLEEGWGAFLDDLRLYLTHFPGERASVVRVSGRANDATPAAAMRVLSEALDGEHGGGLLYGTAVRRGPHEVAFLLDRPVPGIAGAGAFAHGEQGTIVALQVRLFGPDAAAAAAREAERLRAWMDERFPPVEAAVAGQ